MHTYLNLLRDILDNGEERLDRTGVGTRTLFGLQARYDLRDGFPLVTTKKIHFAAVVRELLWFLSGSTNANDLQSTIWDAWMKPDGDLGPIYGSQWRTWGGRGIDQISNTIDTIKTNPTSRRIIISAWNVEDIPRMQLPPCHALFQFNVSGKHLDCQLYQRSADMALGVPFNIASYALLMSMVAQECELTPRHFIHTFGDAHIYLNHLDGIYDQLARAPKALPRLTLANKPTLAMTFEDIGLDGYEHHPAIKFPIAV